MEWNSYSRTVYHFYRCDDNPNLFHEGLNKLRGKKVETWRITRSPSLSLYIYIHIYLSSTSKHKCRNFAIKYWRDKIMRTHESNFRQNCLLIEHFRGVEAGRAKQIQISVSRKWLRGPLSGRSLTVRTPIGGFPGRCELIYNVLDARLPVTLRSPCVYMCVYICVCVCVPRFQSIPRSRELRTSSDLQHRRFSAT